MATDARSLAEQLRLLADDVELQRSEILEDLVTSGGFDFAGFHYTVTKQAAPVVNEPKPGTS